MNYALAARSVNILCDILYWAILIQCIMSWIPSARYTKFYDIVTMITEPILGPIRNLTQRYMDAPIDISPIIGIVLVNIIRRVIFTILF